MHTAEEQLIIFVICQCKYSLKNIGNQPHLGNLTQCSCYVAATQLHAVFVGCVTTTVSSYMYTSSAQENTAVHDNIRLLSLLQEAETDSKPGAEDSSDTAQSQMSSMSITECEGAR